METEIIEKIPAAVAVATKADAVTSEEQSSSKEVMKIPRPRPTRQRGRRSQRGKRRVPADKRRGSGEKRRGQKDKKRGQEEQKEGVAVKRIWNEGKRRWDKKHYCVFCRRPQVKIARHLLKKHADQQEVFAASELPPGSKQRHLLLEQLRCRGNYLHNIEVIRQGCGEIIPWRRPSEDVDARNYLPCPLCLGFFLRADLWKHQASCVKKMNTNTCQSSATDAVTSDAIPCQGSVADTVTSDPVNDATSPSASESDRRPSDQSGPSGADRTPTSDLGTKTHGTSEGPERSGTSDPEGERPRKRFRVQAAASRLLPISSGASESCSEVLHRMNQDLVSHQDGGQRRYDYVSQKLRELGRFLLAAKSLDSGIQNLQDLLVPGHLSLVLSAARKASGYRWSRPPLAVKTTLKTVCEIAIGESLQDGKWETAAKTTDFYHMMGRDWDNLDLLSPSPDHDTALGEAKPKKASGHSGSPKAAFQPRAGVLSQTTHGPATSVIPPGPLQTPVTVPLTPRKVPRRPWSSAEKEAVWRQLGVHVLFQSVPGKEVCQRCLDQEPVLRGRHWKDIKNQVYNQIQSQKKQQFHAQMDSQEHLDQDLVRTRKKQQQQYHVQMDQHEKNPIQNQNKQQYQPQMDHHNHVQVHKKHMYPMDQPQGLQVPLDRDALILTGSSYGPEGPHHVPEQSLMDRESIMSPYQLTPRSSETHLDHLLSRSVWTEETLNQSYPISRDPPPEPPPNPRSGHVHF